jgi:hypothetical protein
MEKLCAQLPPLFLGDFVVNSTLFPRYEGAKTLDVYSINFLEQEK